MDHDAVAGAQVRDLGPDFLRTTADLVASQKRNLDCLLTDLAPILRAAAEPSTIENLQGLLQNDPTGFGYVFSAVDRDPDGAWLRINLLVPIGGEDPDVYVPKRTLPAVPTVSGCASTLTPAPIYAP